MPLRALPVSLANCPVPMLKMVTLGVAFILANTLSRLILLKLS